MYFIASIAHRTKQSERLTRLIPNPTPNLANKQNRVACHALLVSQNIPFPFLLSFEISCITTQCSAIFPYSTRNR